VNPEHLPVVNIQLDKAVRAMKPWSNGASGVVPPAAKAFTTSASTLVRLGQWQPGEARQKTLADRFAQAFSAVSWKVPCAWVNPTFPRRRSARAP
jgi:hypothetical protein